MVDEPSDLTLCRLWREIHGGFGSPGREVSLLPFIWPWREYRSDMEGRLRGADC